MSQLIRGGRVLVHRLVVNNARATLFDGAGSIDLNGNVEY